MAPLARGEMFGKTDAWRQAPSCTQLMFGRQVGRVISHSSPPQDVAAIAEELGVTEAAVAVRRLVKYFVEGDCGMDSQHESSSGHNICLGLLWE